LLHCCGSLRSPSELSHAEKGVGVEKQGTRPSAPALWAGGRRKAGAPLGSRTMLDVAFPLPAATLLRQIGYRLLSHARKLRGLRAPDPASFCCAAYVSLAPAAFMPKVRRRQHASARSPSLTAVRPSAPATVPPASLQRPTHSLTGFVLGVGVTAQPAGGPLSELHRPRATQVGEAIGVPAFDPHQTSAS
jgi:hypothetical protein